MIPGRRHFIIFSSATALMVATWSLLEKFTISETEALSDFLKNYPDLSHLGKSYIDDIGSTNDLSSLRLELNRLLARSGSQNLEQQIFDSMKKDFEIGNIKVINGWMLSQTEASLCAIAYFLLVS